MRVIVFGRSKFSGLANGSEIFSAVPPADVAGAAENAFAG